MRTVLRAVGCGLRAVLRAAPPFFTQPATRSALLAWLTLLPVVCAAASAPHAILFRNGDLLTGQLESLTPTNGLRWRHGDVAGAIQFQPDALAEIHLGSTPRPATSSPTYCFIRLTNGDELAGNLKSIDDRQLVIETWFAGTLTLPRPRVASLRPAGPTPRVIYAGPDGLDGWTMGKPLAGNANPGQWHFVNGAFVASQSASIARDLKLPASSSLEFDLAWRGQFRHAVALYSDTLQPVMLDAAAEQPAFGDFYSLQMFHFGAQQMQVQLMHVRHKGPRRELGLAIFSMPTNNAAQIAIRSSREQKTINLFINSVLVKQWADPEFAVGGTGVRFVAQPVGGSVRLSNLRVFEWDGRVAETLAPLVPNVTVDVGRLMNRDSVAGRLVELKDGKLRFAVADNFIEVPLDRVGQVDFATDRAQAAPFQPGDIRVFFTGRGSLTFALESWTERGVRASSANFGTAEFAPQAFSRIVFRP